MVAGPTGLTVTPSAKELPPPGGGGGAAVVVVDLQVSRGLQPQSLWRIPTAAVS